jgi:hypothetical protein
MPNPLQTSKYNNINIDTVVSYLNNLYGINRGVLQPDDNFTNTKYITDVEKYGQGYLGINNLLNNYLSSGKSSPINDIVNLDVDTNNKLRKIDRLNQSSSNLDNALNDLENTQEIINKETPTNPTKTPSLRQPNVPQSLENRFNRIQNNQYIVEASGIGGDIYNGLKEFFRGPSEPYVGSKQSFTPTLSTKDLQINELNTVLASNAANAYKYLKENGQLDATSSILAETNKNQVQGLQGIAGQEKQWLSSEAQRYDAYRNAQSGIDAQTSNLNMKKKIEENNQSGAIISALQDRILNRFTGVNRQRAEMDKIQEFLKNNKGSDLLFMDKMASLKPEEFERIKKQLKENTDE